MKGFQQEVTRLNPDFRKLSLIALRLERGLPWWRLSLASSCGSGLGRRGSAIRKADLAQNTCRTGQSTPGYSR